MISADATSRQIGRLFSAGAKAYLTKPLNVKKFLHVVGEVLGDPGTEKTLDTPA
jgi:CheY-like chemotaxis protein